MKRTEQQIAADDNLSAAIDQALRAYEYAGPQDVSLEYVVVVAQQNFAGDEDARDSFCTLYRDGQVPHSRALGLLVAARDSLRPERADD